MKQALLLLGLAAATGPMAWAQGGNLVLDADGNYTPSLHRGVGSQPGPDAPGDLLRSFAVSNGSTLSGYAPMNDGAVLQLGTNNLGGLYANLSGGNAEMFAYDFNGSLLQSTPLTDINDSWPGYDGTRNTIICTNAFDDTISGFGGSVGGGGQFFRVSTPTAGPVGAAYDPIRDIYWYSDWTTNELVGLDATDLHGGIATVRDRFSTAAQITRIAGVAYDCLSDCLVSGGRDQGMQVAYDANSKAVVAQWAVLGGSVNDPQGCGLSAESGIATTDFQDLTTRVHEGCDGVRPGLTVFRGAATVFATVTNFASNEGRAIVGWSNSAARTTIKGTQTCLGLPARRAGVLVLNGTPPSGNLSFLPTGTPLNVQAATLPSKTTTNAVQAQ